MNLLSILTPLTKLAGKFITDKTELAKFQSELLSEVLSNDSELVKASAQVITAEAKGESWMQRNWRPITMLVFVFIIANNYVIAPYAAAFGYLVPTLDIPDGMWSLLQIGIGGYIVSRGGEKMVASYAKK